MALTDIRLPALGEGITEATITRWLVKLGDVVTTDTPLVEIATDKVDTEVLSTVDGTVAELLLPEQSTPKIGQVLLRILTDKEEEIIPVAPVAIPLAEEKEAARISDFNISGERPIEPKRERRFVSPFVRHLAISEGITLDNLYKINGSGVEGRITKDDILKYVLSHPKRFTTFSNDFLIKNNGHAAHEEPLSLAPDETAVPMDRVRKLIAKNMLESKHTAPHVTVFSEVDVTPIVEWRNKNKQTFHDKHKEHLTFTPIFLEAVARALSDFPGMNISVKGEFIIKKNSINIGMAVALPDGNLIVPVVKKADQLKLPELARQVNDLSHRARLAKLKPTEIQEGTFTITNVGSFGNTAGTPIINQPQVAILAIGTIAKKPATVSISGVLGIGIRDLITLSLSFDHRAVDGAMGGSFLQRVCQYLMDFNVNREI